MLMVLNNKHEIAVTRFTKEYFTSQNVMNMRAELEVNEQLQDSIALLMACAKAKEIIESIKVYHNENEAYDINGSFGLQDLTENVTEDGVLVTLNFSEL